jgi:hypothetical protein
MTAGTDRAARLWSLPAASPGASGPGAGGLPGHMGSIGGGGDAGGCIIGSVALEVEFTGHGLSNLNTGAIAFGSNDLQDEATVGRLLR